MVICSVLGRDPVQPALQLASTPHLRCRTLYLRASEAHQIP